MSGKQELKRKLVIVGDNGSGKTSLLIYLVHAVFPEIYIPAVFDNCTYSVKIKDTSVALALHDTAVQLDFDNLRPLSYPQSNVILVAFDLSNTKTLNNVLTTWREEVHKHCSGIPVILVGCKKDEWNRYEITMDMIEDARKAIGAVAYADCSAKYGDGVQHVFNLAADFAIKAAT